MKQEQEQEQIPPQCLPKLLSLCFQGGPGVEGPVIVFLIPVDVGNAATTQTLPQLSPPQSGNRACIAAAWGLWKMVPLVIATAIYRGLVSPMLSYSVFQSHQ
jgi:hypothetical protein